MTTCPSVDVHTEIISLVGDLNWRALGPYDLVVTPVSLACGLGRGGVRATFTRLGLDQYRIDACVLTTDAGHFQVLGTAIVATPDLADELFLLVDGHL